MMVGYGTVRTVVWEVGGSNSASYPMPTEGRCTIGATVSVMLSSNIAQGSFHLDSKFRGLLLY